jgi:hypothetical protein
MSRDGIVAKEVLEKAERKSMGAGESKGEGGGGGGKDDRPTASEGKKRRKRGGRKVT